MAEVVLNENIPSCEEENETLEPTNKEAAQQSPTLHLVDEDDDKDISKKKKEEK